MPNSQIEAVELSQADPICKINRWRKEQQAKNDKSKPSPKIVSTWTNEYADILTGKAEAVRAQVVNVTDLIEDLKKPFKNPARDTTIPIKPKGPVIPELTKGYRTIEVPLPRYYAAKDPVIVLTQVKRSLKHGEDGRYDSEGRLICRLSGDPIQEVFVSNRKKLTNGMSMPHHISITEEVLFMGQQLDGLISRDMLDLLVEGTLLDPSSAGVAISKAATVLTGLRLKHPKLQVSSDLFEEIVQKIIVAYRAQVAAVYDLVSGHRGKGDVAAKEQLIGVSGHLPAPLAMRLWEQPWNPISMDWEVEWIPFNSPFDNWYLDEMTFLPNEPESWWDSLAHDSKRTLRGSSMLTPAVAETLATAIDTTLSNQTEDDDQYTDLATLRDRLSDLDVVAAPLGGFHEQVYDELRLEDQGAQAAGKMLSESGIRSGCLIVKRIRIVDTFGQTLQFNEGDALWSSVAIGPSLFPMKKHIPSERLPTESLPSGLALGLPPRMWKAARMNCSFVEPGSNDIAAADTNPICGWCMPDHLDGALEFFDASGQNIGQLRELPPGNPRHPDQSGPELTWEGRPGVNGTWGGEIDSSINLQLRKFIAGMRSWSEEDKQFNEAYAVADKSDPGYDKLVKETALSALLRTIDITSWTVDPLGRNREDHLSVLLGRPIAIVREKVGIDVEGLPAFAELGSRSFRIRLGHAGLHEDGILGYFINDDYRRFFPIHEQIISKAWNHGRRRGPFMQVQHQMDWTDPESLEEAYNQAINHPSIAFDPYITIRPEHSVRVTLLVDPRGRMHATSGILPRRRLDLAEKDVDKALAEMAVTFRVGPVLVDPTEVRMPHPAELGTSWKWIHQSGVGIWQEQDITTPDDRARLGQNVPEIQESWLKLTADQRRT